MIVYWAMFGIGLPELIIIIVVALLVVGPSKLPELARSMGKALGEFRRMADDVKETLEQEMARVDEKEEEKQKEEEQKTAEEKKTEEEKKAEAEQKPEEEQVAGEEKKEEKAEQVAEGTGVHEQQKT